MLNFVTSVLECMIQYNLSFRVVRSELWRSTHNDRVVQQGVREMWEAFGCVFGYDKQSWAWDEEHESCWFGNRNGFREELRTRHIGVSYHVLYRKILRVLRRLVREAVFAPLMGAFAGIVNK